MKTIFGFPIFSIHIYINFFTLLSFKVSEVYPYIPICMYVELVQQKKDIVMMEKASIYIQLFLLYVVRYIKVIFVGINNISAYH